MQEGLRSALAEKSRLAALGSAVSTLAHDLKGMLATAVLVSDRLEASADPEVRRIAPRLVASLDRAIRLCADTLAFARERPRPPRPSRFPLAALVEEARAEALAGADAIGFVAELPVGLEVEADRDQLHRVLVNLLRNAREALGERPGTVRVRARIRGERIAISVIDDGPGVPEAIRGALFTSFVSAGKDDGSGLGLAICRELVRAQGGDIVLERTGPDGTIFTLTLPHPSAAGAAGRWAAA